MFFKILVCWIFTSNLIPIIFARADEDTVLTTHGLVSGKILKTLLKRTQYYGFMGIPYAAPPVKHLRFMVNIDCLHTFLF